MNDRFASIFFKIFFTLNLSLYGAHAASSEALSLADDQRETVADFALIAHNGDFFQLHRNKKAKAIVIYSYGIGCPIARKNVPELKKLRLKYREKDVQFFFLDSNTQDTRVALEKEAREHEIDFPILVDVTQRIAQSLRISRTAEALVIDPKTWEIVYRGAISNGFNYDFESNEAGEHFLADALESFVSDKPIARPRADALGCAITFEKPLVTDYQNTIRPLFENRCSRCHRDLEIGPTNMWSYGEAKGWSKMIGEVVRTERMPPWEFDSHYRKLRRDEALTDQEKKLLYSWLETGSPEKRSGAVKIAVTKPLRPPPFKSGFSLKMSSTIEVPADTKTPWHYEELNFNRTRDLLIKGFRANFKTRKNVQHIALLVMKKPIDLSRNIFQPEYLQSADILNIIRLSPNYPGPVSLVGNQVFRIPKDAHLYLELHFSLTGKNEQQHVEIEIEEFGGNGKPVELIYNPLDVASFTIPPNTKSYKLRARRTIERDIHIVRMGPHMHWRGRSAKLLKITPAGQPGENEKKEILGSWRYVFKNRATVQFQEPLLIKAGSILEAEFEYDNSEDNPARIDHSRPVRFGPDAFLNEMANMHLLYY